MKFIVQSTDVILDNSVYFKLSNILPPYILPYAYSFYYLILESASVSNLVSVKL